ncbi:MAG TPA: hypothetical protein VFA12_06495 [Stellaceae bacterium]|nr:hypothetical protein [Stellaceae bacterium]
MDDVAIARAIHVLAVVVWIGGVSMVTTALLPAARGDADGFALFQRVERRFAWQARVATLLAGASGFYMVVRFELWERFAEPHYWWMTAMVAVWAIFSFVLFIAEPLFLERWLRARAAARPQATFALLLGFHWVMLVLSLITVFGAVAGSHGFAAFS